VVLNVLWVLQVMVLGSGLDLRIPALAPLCHCSGYLCISALPITPNGLGVRENLFGADAGRFRSPRTAALSVSLLASAEGLSGAWWGGVIYMGFAEKEHLEEVTTPKPRPAIRSFESTAQNGG